MLQVSSLDKAIMKILHVGPVTLKHASGLPESICGSTSAQAAIGLEVALLPSSPPDRDELSERVRGVRLIEGPCRRYYNPWFVSRDWIVRILEEFGKPDLVVFHSTYIPFHIALARRCRRVGWPYIVTPHGGMTEVAQEIKKIKKLIGNILFFRSFVKRAAAIHTKSELSAAQIRVFFDVKDVFVVPNAVNDELFSVGESLAAADLGDFATGVDLMLGFIGRIYVPHKGIDLLLEAMSILKSGREGPICKLLMVGPFFTKKDQDYVLSTIRSCGLGDIVKLVGSKFGHEKWSYFLACDVFVHTSRFEAGIPIALLEAMALGRPYLATPGAIMGDVIQEGCGWMSEPDPDSIANTICNIYKSKETLPATGKRSRDFARSHFTWNKIAEREREEYARIISRNSG
jgi:glycosyltransferase involved in cell wall biosynthesis